MQYNIATMHKMAQLRVEVLSEEYQCTRRSLNFLFTHEGIKRKSKKKKDITESQTSSVIQNWGIWFRRAKFFKKYVFLWFQSEAL